MLYGDVDEPGKALVHGNTCYKSQKWDRGLMKVSTWECMWTERSEEAPH